MFHRGAVSVYSSMCSAYGSDFRVIKFKIFKDRCAYEGLLAFFCCLGAVCITTVNAVGGGDVTLHGMN